MSLEKAVASYMGQDGKRLNCAQSVVNGFREEFGVPEKKVEEYAAFGRGNAPDGVCGAYYAAKTLLEKHGLNTDKLEQTFCESAGSLKCREIRANRKLTCRGCVETCAKVLDSKRLNGSGNHA